MENTSNFNTDLIFLHFSFSQRTCKIVMHLTAIVCGRETAEALESARMSTAAQAF